MGRIGKFEGEDRKWAEHYPHLLRLDLEGLEGDLTYIAEEVRAHITFEPTQDKRLLDAAVNLLHFIEAYEARSGSLDLPPEET